MPSDAPANVISLLQAMVRIDSVNGAVSGRPFAEAELAEALEHWARRWGLECTRLPIDDNRHNLLITCDAAADRPWLLFDSHMDTVSVEGMTIDPFGATIDDGKLYGRGACDTKGTGAAMLWALREYADRPTAERPNNIALLFSCDEEITMTGIRAFIANDLPHLDFAPRGVVVGEPTGMNSLVAHNGVTGWAVQTHGVAAHSATPYLGKSAIRMMMKVIDAIESRYITPLDVPHPLTGGAVASINVIHGGTQTNIIPERCEIFVDRRTAPGESAEDALAAIKAVLDRLVEQDADVDYSITTQRTVPPLDDSTNVDLQAIVEAAQKASGLPARKLGAPFATHAGPLSAAGLQAVVIGPGDPHPAHTKDEWVEVAQIEKGVELYLNLMAGPLA